jgi:multidrug efflux pump
MHFSELFIRRPVLSMVLGAFILLLGFQGIFNLAVRQYPEVEETVVTITTSYPGAPPDLIQGFITAPIAQAVATTENIDYLTSQSSPSVSIVSVNMQLGANPDVALTEVLSKVQQVRGVLPAEADDPVIVKGTGFDFALMYLAAVNPTMTQEQARVEINTRPFGFLGKLILSPDPYLFRAEPGASRDWRTPIFHFS